MFFPFPCAAPFHAASNTLASRTGNTRLPAPTIGWHPNPAGAHDDSFGCGSTRLGGRVPIRFRLGQHLLERRRIDLEQHVPLFDLNAVLGDLLQRSAYPDRHRYIRVKIHPPRKILERRDLRRTGRLTVTAVGPAA